MGVIVVIVIRSNSDAFRLRMGNGRNKEVGVHNARLRMIVVMIVARVFVARMNVLKRRNHECQNNCQACLNGQRATHRLKCTKPMSGAIPAGAIAENRP